jgi:RimJ/RimL family protein N-acetyltransferase
MSEISYRTATLDDAALASDLMTAAYPPMPQDPVMTCYHWEHPRRDYAYGRFIAERKGSPIAYSGWIHGPWERLPDRHCEVEVWLDRAAMEPELLLSIWTWISDQAIQEGAHLLLAYCGEDEPEMQAALAALGFKRDRVEKVSELDLVVHGKRLVAEAQQAKAAAGKAGIELITLAAWQAPDKLSRLYDLDAITKQDVPHTLPILRETLVDFERRMEAPDRPEDRVWVAVAAGRPVAMTYLKFPPVRGSVWTGYTCTDPGFRGRGLARAVKLQSLAQAVELGVPVVRTDNDADNAPMLAINRALGYSPRPGFVAHLKRVETPHDG